MRSQNILTPPTIVLIAVNLLPLYGVVVLGWEVFPLIFLYWFENIIVGVFNVFRIIFSQPKNILENLQKIIMIPFFCVHYGGFTAVHGVFVFALFRGKTEFSGFPASVPNIISVIDEYGLLPILFGLVMSRGLSFFWNYIGKEEYKKVDMSTLMGQPYLRIVVLHMTLIFGGFIIMALKSPAYALVLFIFLKIAFDLGAHLKEHKRLAARGMRPDLP